MFIPSSSIPVQPIPSFSRFHRSALIFGASEPLTDDLKFEVVQHIMAKREESFEKEQRQLEDRLSQADAFRIELLKKAEKTWEFNDSEFTKQIKDANRRREDMEAANVNAARKRRRLS